MSTTQTSPVPDDTGAAVTHSAGRLDDASKFRIAAILLVIVLYTEIAPLQYTMVAAALQKMTATFPTVGGNINWAVIILGLVGASATPVLGKASDIWGKKRMLLVCGVLFLAGCVICASTSNWTIFLIGRGLSAFAIATQFISYGLVRDLLPRKYVPIGLGFIGTGVGFSGVAAPLIGGVLVDHFDWRSMFWFLAIFTIVLTPLVIFLVPESTVRLRDRIDPFGAVLLSAGALLTLLYLDNGQNWGWTRATSLLWLIVGLLLLVSFVVVERRVSRPIMDMRLLLNPKVSVVLLMTVIGMGITAVQPLALGYMTQTPNSETLRGQIAEGAAAHAQAAGHPIPRDMIRVFLDPGYSYGNGYGMVQYAVHIGMWAGVLGMIVGPFAGALIRRIGGRIPAIIAFALLTVSAIGFAVSQYSLVTYLVLYILSGIAFGFLYAALPSLIVEAVPPEQQGISSGMLGVTTSLGTGAAMAVTTALLNNNPVVAHIDIAGHTTTQVIPQVFADRGYTDSFWVMVGTTAVALVIAVLMRHGRRPATGGE